jgi:hypothetical protein
MWAKLELWHIVHELATGIWWLIEQYCTEEESYGEDNILKKNIAKIYSISR